jgi:hypothetical protein
LSFAAAGAGAALWVCAAGAAGAAEVVGPTG